MLLRGLIPTGGMTCERFARTRAAIVTREAEGFAEGTIRPPENAAICLRLGQGQNRRFGRAMSNGYLRITRFGQTVVGNGLLLSQRRVMDRPLTGSTVSIEESERTVWLMKSGKGRSQPVNSSATRAITGSASTQTTSS